MHIVICYQDPDIAILKMRYNPLDILYCNGVYPREGFVEQDEFGIESQCPCDFCATTLTA